MEAWLCCPCAHSHVRVWDCLGSTTCDGSVGLSEYLHHHRQDGKEALPLPTCSKHLKLGRSFRLDWIHIWWCISLHFQQSHDKTAVGKKTARLVFSIALSSLLIILLPGFQAVNRSCQQLLGVREISCGIVDHRQYVHML